MDADLVANIVGTTQSTTLKPYTTALPDAPRAQRIEPGQAVSASVAQFGTDYFELPLNAGTTVRFTGQPTVPLVGTTPLDGDAMWYAGRADSSVAPAGPWERRSEAVGNRR